MNPASRFLGSLSLVLLAAVGAACASTGNGGGGGDSGAPLVLVAGATGATGQEAVRQALTKGYAVRALVRNEEAARQLFGERVQYAVGNVRDPAAVARAVRGATYLISALGSRSQRDPGNKPEYIDYGGVKNLVDAAQAAGVKHFALVSSMGVTREDHPLNKMFDNILIWKLKGEDALRASGVPYTIVRPSGLNDDPPGRAGLQVMQGDPPIQGHVSRADIAAICVNALGNEAARSKTLEVIGTAGTPPADWSALFAGLRADGA
ncbi:MAG: SDR family oxidoreductase [Sinobacteraceae bacterium]|nr:SDR family oxidoreductase [Nevskiaceae bacterium]MCP5470702.1 SDR family oxidoreductase [Nevskiaceae bacterium]